MRKLSLILILAVISLIATAQTVETVYLAIGEWNMDTTAIKAVNIPANIDRMKIINVQVWIRGDHSRVNQYPLDFHRIDSSVPEGTFYVRDGLIFDDPDIVFCIRLQYGEFDNANYDNDNNRGWVIITYRTD